MRTRGSNGDSSEIKPTAPRARRVRKARLIVVGIIVVAVGAVLVLRDSRSVGEHLVVSAAPAPSAVARTVESTAFAHPAAASAAPTDPPRVPAGDEIEVCGVGIVKRTELERPDFGARHFRDPKALVEQWLASLRSSSDEAVRAAGHYLAASLSQKSVEPSLLDRVQACGQNVECTTQEIRDALFGGSNATREIDTLVDEAVTTKDPFVYAMAVQACGAGDPKSKRGGQCQLITLDRWTQLDGDNFVPWVFLAAAAEARGDAAAREEALYRASIASGSRIAGQELLGRTLPSMPSDLSQFERFTLDFSAVGVASAWVLAPFQVVTRACSAEAVRDANVHQVCDGLASVLADRSDTLIERAIGIGMAERLGWPTERVEAKKKERDAYYQAASLRSPSDALDCASLQKTNADLLSRSRMGELAFTRALVAESRQTVDALAEQFAERRRVGVKARANLIHEAAASAAEASAASVTDTG